MAFLGFARASLVAALLLWGCGVAVVDKDYQGEPLLSFEGQIYNFTPENASVAGTIRPALFWTDGIDAHGAPEKLIESGRLVEDSSVAVHIEFPSKFKVNVFKRPDASWFVKDKPYAIGFILLYADTDDLGYYDREKDTFIGQAHGKIVIYASRDLTAEESPTKMAMSPGMRLVEVPLYCSDEPWGEALPSDGCGISLGVACDSDHACSSWPPNEGRAWGQGTCLKTHDGYPLKNGYCVLNLEVAGECFPSDGMLIWGSTDDQSYYFKACTKPGDCRESEGYVCLADGYCYPSFPVTLTVSAEEFETAIMPICREEWCELLPDPEACDEED